VIGVDVAELRELHEAATPGELSIRLNANEHSMFYELVYRGDDGLDYAIATGLIEEDAVLIAALRNAAPALLAGAEAVERVRALCDDAPSLRRYIGVSRFAEMVRAALEGGA
jgi:hypothetical protein